MLKLSNSSIIFVSTFVFSFPKNTLNRVCTLQLLSYNPLLIYQALLILWKEVREGKHSFTLWQVCLLVGLSL